MRSPLPRIAISGNCDATGAATVTNQIVSPAGFWSLVYCAVQVSSGSAGWAVQLGSKATSAPLVFGQGQQAMLGPFLLMPGEYATLTVKGADASAVVSGQALGWQSDDPEELLGSTPITTALATPITPLPISGAVSILGVPSVITNPGSFTELLAGSGALLGDTTVAVQVADSVQETISTSGSISSSVAVLASFKPSGGTPALVKSGTVAEGSAGSVSPAFGAATAAGHLLVAVVSAYGAAPATAAAGWSQAVIGVVGGGGTQLAIWIKPNSAGADAAPTFTGGLGPGLMQAVLMEFSNIAVAAPTDQTGNFAQTGAASAITASAGSVDGTASDLVVFGAHWRSGGAPFTATFQDTFNNGATGTRAADNGSTSDQDHTVASFAVIPAFRATAALGISSFAMPSWPGKYDGQANAAPAAGTKATVTLAANATKRWVADNVEGTVGNSTAANTHLTQLNLIDGASGGGTFLARYMTFLPAAIGNLYVGGSAKRYANAAVNTALTLEFAAAPAVTVSQTVNLGAYLQ